MPSCSNHSAAGMDDRALNRPELFMDLDLRHTYPFNIGVHDSRARPCAFKGRNTLKDQIHPVDIHVGDRLKFFRVQAGLSQQAIAKSVGLTFQQIQKYEKGTNRISASRLYEFSQILGHPVQDFFAGLKQGDPTPLVAPSRLDYEILNLLGGLTDDRVKRQIRAMLSAMTERPRQASALEAL